MLRRHHRLLGTLLGLMVLLVGVVRPAQAQIAFSADLGAKQEDTATVSHLSIDTQSSTVPAGASIIVVAVAEADSSSQRPTGVSCSDNTRMGNTWTTDASVSS